MTNILRHNDGDSSHEEISRLFAAVCRAIGEHTEYEVDCFDPSSVLPLITVRPDDDPLEKAQAVISRMLKNTSNEICEALLNRASWKANGTSRCIHAARGHLHECDEDEDSDIGARIRSLSSDYVRFVLAKRILLRVTKSTGREESL